MSTPITHIVLAEKVFNKNFSDLSIRDCLKIPTPHINIAVDFIEDELLYNKVGNWNEIINFFKEILPEEEKFNTSIKNTDILKWHQIMRDNFYKAPNE